MDEFCDEEDTQLEETDLAQERGVKGCGREREREKEKERETMQRKDM